jgi:hypothetical protein
MTIKEHSMAEKPIDLAAVRRADDQLAQLLQDHPELRNPERAEALEAWLQSLDTEKDTDDGATEEVR